MDSSSASRVAVTPDSVRISNLSLLLAAINETCKKRDGITYSSSATGGGKSLTNLQTYLCKLAQTCDNQKGTSTITSLVLLNEGGRPVYLFTSNFRKEAELEEVGAFLSDLLDYVGLNPDMLRQKPLQKQVLWRILVFNADKLTYYLTTLSSIVEKCIEDCKSYSEPSNSEMIKNLHTLQENVSFSYDMTSSDNARDKFLSDCESLMKVIQGLKVNLFDTMIDRYVGKADADSSMLWHQLRHYLGRLHSYRQASEVIVNAAKEWPEAFDNYEVRHVASARNKRMPSPKSSNLSELLPLAFSEIYLTDIEGDIDELKDFGLEKEIRDQLRRRGVRSYVHSEVHLHDHLVQLGKTRQSHFWDMSMFIATSKPVCRLCHLYFKNPENNFLVQPPHMNIYTKWRLPDVYEDQSQEVKENSEDIMEDMIEQLQQDTLEALKKKIAQYKRNDSNTDTHVGSRLENRLPYSPSFRTESSMSMGEGGRTEERRTGISHPGHLSAVDEGDDYVGVDDDVENDDPFTAGTAAPQGVSLRNMR